MSDAASRSLSPWALGVAAAALLLHLLHNVLLPFVIAAVTAYVLAPVLEWLVVRTRLPRWSVGLGLLGVLMGLAALVGLLGLPLLMRQAQSVVSDLHGAVTDFMRALIGTHSVRLLGSNLDAQHLAELVVSAIQRELTGTRLLALVGLTAAATFGFMLIWVLIGYFLLDWRGIGAGLLWLVPPRSRERVESIWHELDPILRRYFIGVTAIVVYATAAAYLGLGLVLGLHHALLLALFTGCLEIIPLVGPAAAAVVAGLVAVEQSARSWDIWAYVLYAIVLRLSIDQLVGPIVLGNAARLRPVVVIFCFLAGGVLFGIIGMILAVPTALFIKVTLSVIYREAR